MDVSTTAGDIPDHVSIVQKLFIRHNAALRDYLLALLPNANVVDDLLHDIFLTAIERADQFEPGTNFLAWVRTMGKFKILESARAGRRDLQTFPPEVIELLSAAAPNFEEDSERLTAMGECIDELAPRSREAIALRYAESLLPNDIARRMSLTVDSVHVMLSRARRALRDCILLKLRAQE